MTDEMKQFVEELREPVWGESVRVVNDRLRTAALMIEFLSASREQVKQERDGLNIMLTSATSAAETYKRERDALLRELKARFGCEMCTHQAPKGFDDYISNDCMDCINFCNWQWRGAKVDQEEK